MVVEREASGVIHDHVEETGMNHAKQINLVRLCINVLTT